MSDGESGMESVTNRPISRSASPYVGHYNLEDGLLGYAGIFSHHFTDLSAFGKICEMHADLLREGVGTRQYVAFRGVSLGTWNDIDRMREEGSLPRMRVLYDGGEKILIAKIMVGVTHDLAKTIFIKMFFFHVAQVGLPRNAVESVGSARFGDSRSKEGDDTYKPQSRNLTSDWPSIAVEVGVLESLAQLRTDAHFWLTKSGGQVRIVIILSITETGARELCIERWEIPPLRRALRPTPRRMSPALMQSITLQENVPYNGSSLVIPVEGVFDVVPGGLPLGEFQFSAHELSTFNDDLWSVLG